MEDLSSEQSNVLNTIAHELKNPLIVINGHADLIKSDDLEVKKHIESIKTVTGRLLKTIDTLLLSGKLDSTHADVKIELFDINEQIRLVTEELAQQLISRNQKIIFRNTKRLARVYGNPTYTYLALYNLIENASKYSPDKTDITISIRTTQNSLKILVRDQGVGINKPDIERLFTQFGKLKSPLHQRPNSTGLGLYIARRLLEIMNGRLNYINVRGGSCFVASLPTTEQLRLF